MAPGNAHTPEGRARDRIDSLLEEAGWVLQWQDEKNLYAAKGVALREQQTDVGPVDYALFVDGQAVGVIEAKPEGTTLSGVVPQAIDYARSVPSHVPAPVRPLPFAYVSTGAVTEFRNGLDPEPRSREIFQFHRPETLVEWIGAETLTQWLGSRDSKIAESGLSGIPYAEPALARGPHGVRRLLQAGVTARAQADLGREEEPRGALARLRLRRDREPRQG